MPTLTPNHVLSADTWRQVDNFAPAAIQAIITAATGRRSPESTASLLAAVDAGIPVPPGFAVGASDAHQIFAQRLQSIAHWATYGMDEEVSVLEAWLVRIAKTDLGAFADQASRALDASVKAWVSAKPWSGSPGPNPAVVQLLRRYGARIDRPPRDAKGKAIGESVLAKVLARDSAEFLDLWYAGARFDANHPIPQLHPVGSYKEVGAVAATLCALKDAPVKSAAWFLSHLDDDYRAPLEEAFAVGFQILENAQGKERDLAVRIMGKVVAAGGAPARTRRHEPITVWRKLLATRCGELNFRFPAAVIHEYRGCEDALEKMFQAGALDIDDPGGGTLLHHAVIADRQVVVESLLRRGASTSIPYEHDAMTKYPGAEQYEGKTAAEVAAPGLAAIIQATTARRAIKSTFRNVENQAPLDR